MKDTRAQMRRSTGAGRTYDIGGEQLPSVTTIINAVPGKDRILQAWAVKQALLDGAKRADLLAEDPEAWLDIAKGAPGRSMRESGKIGTAVHEAVEAGYIPAPLQAWLDTNVDQVLGQEVVLASTAHRYAGTADYVLLMKNGSVAVADLKTGKGLYAEVALQLCAYARSDVAFSAQGGEADDAPKMTRGIGLHLRDGKLAVWEASLTDEVFEVFLGLRAAWEWYEVRGRAIQRVKGNGVR